MATLNAASLTSVLSATVATATAENIIDAAINRIAAHGYTMTQLTGTTPNKTKTCSQPEHGWIVTVAVAIYAKEYSSSGASSESIGVGSLSHSNSVSSAGGSYGSPDELAEQAAYTLRNLKERDWARAII